MRREPYGVGSFVHVMKRGARGLPITKDAHDQWRFVRLLYHLNDEFKDEFWEEATHRLDMFERPRRWPARDYLVKIHAWVLMPNHFHLLLEEIKEGGISRFMQKVCGSMTLHFNLKYDEKGSIFQGAYKSRTVETDRYFRYLVPYIMVKNVFELYPGGIEVAAKDFDHAWEWAAHNYSFSSLPDYLWRKTVPVIHRDALAMFDSTDSLRSLSKDMIRGRYDYAMTPFEL